MPGSLPVVIGAVRNALARWGGPPLTAAGTASTRRSPLLSAAPSIPPRSPPPLRSFLAELEMRLHLSAEDVGLYLQDHATRAQQRIPAAAKELLRIQVRRGASIPD